MPRNHQILHIELFRGELSAWYRTQRRNLPWRRTRDPYRIWVSETMLQQTRVSIVIPYYKRFIKHFPNLRSLARARIDEVLPLWSGLGYYRRIRNLHAAARLIVENHQGRIPRNPKALLALPGIGRYTAGALMSIAFHSAEPVVDGNVTRVLCRLYEIEENPEKSAVKKELWRIAGDLVPDQGAADFNQALMELGATICLRQHPLCNTCPVRNHCRARRKGRVEELPRRDVSGRNEKCTYVSVIVCRRGRLLILQRDHPTLMSGLWEFPMVELAAGNGFDATRARALFQDRCGLNLADIAVIGHANHSITYRRITLHVCRARLRGQVPGGRAGRWITPAEIQDLGVSSLSLKALRMFEQR